MSSRRIDLGQEGIVITAVRSLKRVCRWKVSRSGLARNIPVADCVHSESKANVIAAAAQITGVKEASAGAHLDDKGIVRAAPVCRLKRAQGGKTGGSSLT